MQPKITAYFKGNENKPQKRELEDILRQQMDSFNASYKDQVKDHNLELTIYHTIFSSEFCKALYDLLYWYGNFPNPHKNRDGQYSKKRNKLMFGSIDTYEVVYFEQTIVHKVSPWSDMPILEQVRDLLTKLTGDKYNVCAIQYYNNGAVGIKPHRDKEMASGTTITSLSLGETRVMRFENKDKQIDINLASGTLCCICPPTNDAWLHSIPLDNSRKGRMSVIFRVR